MIDLAGAAAMGAFAKHKIKSDHAKGRGQASVEAAAVVYGMNAFRRSSAGLLALGGLYGVNSALKDIEKEEQRSKQTVRRHTYIPDDGIDLSFYKTNDNRYAWRLNCEDGSGYGICPEDYESREEYNEALREAKEDFGEFYEYTDDEPSDTDTAEAASSEPSGGICFCRVSLLSSGKTEYFRTDDQTIKRGEIVIVPDGAGTTSGVVVSADKYPAGAYPLPPEEVKAIIGRK